MLNIIAKKRDGEVLSGQEIKTIVENIVEGKASDAQLSALLMAIYINGLNSDEIVALSFAMSDYGRKMDYSMLNTITVSKHSIGGVGDKTTLCVGPILAACGVSFPKISDRYFGFIGGTIDKVNSIPNINTNLSREQFIDTLSRVGFAISTPMDDLNPSERILLALRKETATYGSLGLIAASIMSQELSNNCDKILLDIKCGKGSYCQNRDQAEYLARLMIEIGTKAGKETVAVIANMNQPLGDTIGNSIEVIETINFLKGRASKELTEYVLNIATILIIMGGRASSRIEAYEKAKMALNSGVALRTFKNFVAAQSGDSSVIDEISTLSRPKYSLDILAEESGYVCEIDTMELGYVANEISQFEDGSMDYSAGLLLNKKIGQWVNKGDVLMRIFGNQKEPLYQQKNAILDAYLIGQNQFKREAALLNIIDANGNSIK